MDKACCCNIRRCRSAIHTYGRPSKSKPVRNRRWTLTRSVPVRPYITDDLPGFDLAIPNVTTVDPVRTFWDKVLILHSLRRSFEDRGVLRGSGQRVSRHYSDVDRMLRTDTGRRAAADLAMAEDCLRHERMFFKRAGQDTALPGTFALVPPPAMLDLLRVDYQAMAVMIFGDVPPFDTVIESIATLEATVNR